MIISNQTNKQHCRDGNNQFYKPINQHFFIMFICKNNFIIYNHKNNTKQTKKAHGITNPTSNTIEEEKEKDRLERLN